MKVNPLNAYNYLRYGMCLDWLGRHTLANRYYQRALELDPNSYYMTAHYGWHFYSKGDYTTAKEWFEKSLKLSDWRPNDMAHAHLRVIARVLQDKAVTPSPQ
jgi:tetratricopeptide (TPR) repeat protein